MIKSGALKPKLLDPVRSIKRTKHLSIRTKQSYIKRIRQYIFLSPINPSTNLPHKLPKQFQFILHKRYNSDRETAINSFLKFHRKIDPEE